MRLNSETNRFFIIITVMYTVLLALSIYLKIGTMPVKVGQYPALEPALQIIYILLMIYLVRVLKAFDEKSAVVTALILYTCIRGAYAIIKFFPEAKLGSSYVAPMGFLTIVIGIYFFIQLFRIQNRYISLPYILFGFSLVLVFVAEIALIVVFRVSPYPAIANYMRFVDLLTPLCILFILKRVSAFINEQSTQSMF